MGSKIFTGSQCKKCLGYERYVKGHACVICTHARNRAGARRWGKANPEKCAEHARKWRQTHPVANTSNGRKRTKRWRQNNLEKVAATRRVWRTKNRDKVLAEYSPEKRRRYYDRDRSYWSDIKRLYGLTQEQYNCLLAQQGNSCAICKVVSEARLQVDHDHITGLVRGLLCGRCNKGLSMFDEQIARLNAAADYMESRAHDYGFEYASNINGSDLMLCSVVYLERHGLAHD